MTEGTPPRAGRRADAVRNATAVLDAAALCLSRDADASMAEIAKAAGVGRVTVYAHFADRAELVEAVATRAIAEGDAALDALDISGDPQEALVRLIRQSWLSIVQVGSLMSAAAGTLSPERIRELHRGPASRVELLIERGRTTGAFRTDLPTAWLVGTLHRLMQGAAEDVADGRLRAEAAADTIAATALAAFTAPGAAVPPLPAALGR
jgi:TetR/AcrR family transcriptional repressor of mexCD-oprJ operon